MDSSGPPGSNLPASMGPGGRPVQPGESAKSLLHEITEIRSHYDIHLAPEAIELSYQIKGQQRFYRLPFDNIPVGGWTRSACFGKRKRAAVTGTLLIDLIRGTENATGRQITQEEAEGLAFYGSRRMFTMYLGQVGVVGLGLGSAWFGRRAMKFPFRTPKPLDRYENFPARVMPILKGRNARFMWHVTRVNVYIFMWLLLTSPVITSMADTRMTVGLYQDRRTNGLTEALKQNFDRLRSNRANASAKGKMIETQAQPTRDDASPSVQDDRQTFSDDSFAADSTFTDGNTDTGLISDRAMQQRQTKQASPNSWSKAQSRATKSDQEQQQSYSSGDIFFDDASPTAGNNPDMNASSRQPAGNAWSRKRRDESPRYDRDDQRTYGRQSQDFETKGDSFSFSDSEEEKFLAKQQAQKEFDAMLEKERREGGSGDYARDMQATTAGQESNSSSESAWSKYRKGRSR